MLLNCAQQVRGPSVMQEENPLPHAPKRRGAELSRTGLALAHSVRQPYTHVVDQQVGEEIDRVLFSAATVELPVVNEGVWHSAHPISAHFCLPFAMDVDPPGASGVGSCASRER